LILFAACESAPVKKTEVFQIRTIGSISTTEYTLSKVLKWNDVGEWYKFGDRKILISCKATVKAGVDLNKIKDQDIVVRGNSIQIKLPPPEIISFNMDPNHIKTELVSVNGLRAEFSQVDKAAVLKKGEQLIRKDLKQLNILNDAERQAKLFVIDYFKNYGFEEVIVHETPKDKRHSQLDR
jgi:hypothetical protein